jgi:CHAT domain-containing protein
MAIPRGAVLAEYYAYEDQILLFMGRSDLAEPHVAKITIPLKDVRQFALAHFAASGDHTRVRQLDLNEWQSAMAPLVEPIAAVAEEGDVVWLVPHDVLHHLPLHALQVEGRYLAERNPTCYTSSASIMKYCKGKRKGTRHRALVLGDSRDDLRYACEEAHLVADMFNTVAHLGKGATKALVRHTLETEGTDVDVWHFACHIYFDGEQPLKSAIVLAPDKSVNPRHGHDREWNLTVEEIFGLQFNADLIVLSGCTSGVNDRRPGDELIGLTRALIYAGTPSVIASLWVVDDLSTSILMQDFYEELRKPSTGHVPVTKAEALRKAQTHVRGMTAGEVIDYCDRRLVGLAASGQAGRSEVLRRGRAEVSALAGGVPLTPAPYETAGFAMRDGEIELGGRDVSMIKAAAGIPSRAQMNPDIRPFEHPYYWAPFVLIGDWN